tara:strand:+ start:381 stop:935 length:555 start_codon:yes stop_codon:yes gene_type:complete
MKVEEKNDDCLFSMNYEDLGHLKNVKMPEISLPNQEGNLLKLNRSDTFRLVLYCFPMTGRPDRSLPPNWNSIAGAKGCTSQNISFRDNYDKFIILNSIPIGISTQPIGDLKELVTRLNIPYDILSDINLEFKKILNLPTFSINEKSYLKRLTLIIEKSVIKKIFYPINNPNKHVIDVLEWLKLN